MEIVINRLEHSVQLKKEQKSAWRKAVKKVKERRRAARDRRRSVNDGLLVRLSTRKDRRAEIGRRFAAQQSDLREKDPPEPSRASSHFRVLV